MKKTLLPVFLIVMVIGCATQTSVNELNDRLSKIERRRAGADAQLTPRQLEIIKSQEDLIENFVFEHLGLRFGDKYVEGVSSLDDSKSKDVELKVPFRYVFRATCTYRKEELEQVRFYASFQEKYSIKAIDAERELTYKDFSDAIGGALKDNLAMRYGRTVNVGKFSIYLDGANREGEISFSITDNSFKQKIEDAKLPLPDFAEYKKEEKEHPSASSRRFGRLRSFGEVREPKVELLESKMTFSEAVTAAKGNEAKGYFALGCAYLTGEDVERNDKAAIYCLERAAEMKDANATLLLAMIEECKHPGVEGASIKKGGDVNRRPGLLFGRRRSQNSSGERYESLPKPELRRYLGSYCYFQYESGRPAFTNLEDVLVLKMKYASAFKNGALAASNEISRIDEWIWGRNEWAITNASMQATTKIEQERVLKNFNAAKELFPTNFFEVNRNQHNHGFDGEREAELRQRESERAEQRQQLLAIQEELRRVRIAKGQPVDEASIAGKGLLSRRRHTTEIARQEIPIDPGEFDPMLPVKTFGIFTVGKAIDSRQNQNIKWLSGPETYNSKYVTAVNGRDFEVMVCKRNGAKSAVSSVSARPVELFATREDALPYYEYLKKYVNDNWDASKGDKPHEHPKYKSQGEKQDGERIYSWYSQENCNVEISVRLCRFKNFQAQTEKGEGEKWYVGIFLKDIYSYCKEEFKQREIKAWRERVQKRKDFVPTRRKLEDWEKCIVVEYRKFIEDEKAKAKGTPKFDLEKYTGHKFGESSEWTQEYYKFSCHGASCPISDGLPPFTQMHRLFGCPPGSPMGWCHFGLIKKVEPDELTIKGDYANEARLIKERIEKGSNLTMTDYRGHGYQYEDDFVRITISTNSYTTTAVTNERKDYPLTVDIHDKILDAGDRFFRERLEFWKAHGTDPKYKEEVEKLAGEFTE